MSSESIISVSLKNGTKGIVKNVLYEEVRVRGRKAFRYYVSGNVKGTRTPFRMKVTSDEALALAEELDIYMTRINPPSASDHFKFRVPF